MRPGEALPTGLVNFDLAVLFLGSIILHLYVAAWGMDYFLWAKTTRWRPKFARRAALCQIRRNPKKSRQAFTFAELTKRCKPSSPIPKTTEVIESTTVQGLIPNRPV